MPRRKTPQPPKQAIVLKVALRDIEPEIWRRVQVPEHCTLDRLHRVFQMVFGWLDYHLFEFEIAGRRFEAPDEDAEFEDASKADLRSLKLKEGDRFQYVYDFGDNWIHDCTVERMVSIDDEWQLFPQLLDGQLAGPHEDCGGPYGYSDLREALSDPNHPQHKDMRDWVGPHYNPDRFDPWMANQNLILAAAWGKI